VSGIATGPDDLPALCAELAPHVVVLDYRLADDTGYARARHAVDFKQRRRQLRRYATRSR